MARIRFERRNSPAPAEHSLEGMEESFALVPAPRAGSSKNFCPPATIESDFERLLMHDVPNVNYTFDLIHDWYDHIEEHEEHNYIRAQQTPIDWKSKIGNSDMSTNFKVSHKTAIYKGDMVIREDGLVYLLNWMIQSHPNNQATQSILCNARLTFTRLLPEEVDENGYLLSDNTQVVIAGELPCTHSEYAGRPDFALSQGAAGIAPDHLITVSVQWNKQTRNIRVGDNFTLGDYTYRVINVSMAEVDIDEKHGVLLLNARRVAGGFDD